MFSVTIKIKGEDEMTLQAETSGMQTDYQFPIYYVRLPTGEQFEIPVTEISYLKFSKERFESCDQEPKE